MTPALLDRPVIPLFEHEPAPGRTCDDELSDLWADLLREQPSACLLCGGQVLPRVSAGAGVVGGRCRSCGTAID